MNPSSSSWFDESAEGITRELAKAGFRKPPTPPPVPPRPGLAAAAMREFSRAISGTPPRVNSYQASAHRPLPVTPRMGLDAILEAVREAGRREGSDAVLKAAGEWITKVTNGITAVVKEFDD